MLVLLHINIALLSIIYSTYVYFSPSRTKLQISYTLVGLTLASGTYLVLKTHSPMLQACVSGLIYLAVASAAIGLAYRRLLKQENNGERD